MKIIFFGTPDFAVESLRAIHEAGYDIAAVVTMPDKPAGRGHKLLHSPVKQYAVTHGLRLLQPVKLKDPTFVAELRELNADLFIVIAFRMLPEVVWQMPPSGTFNLHASLLPRYRGAAPINRAVMNGDTETGVTTFFLKHEIDTGDIISQERVAIADSDNVGDVHDRLMKTGARLTLDTLRHIEAGDLKPIPQDELIGDTEPTPAPKIYAEDMIIDWSKSATQVRNLVRGLSPYPAARTTLVTDDSAPQQVKIYAAEFTDCTVPLLPGQIEAGSATLIAGTGDGNLEITSLQPAGKRRMTTAEWLRGARLGKSPRFQ